MSAANPGIKDSIKPIEELWLAVERARSAPGFESSSRADDLNQGNVAIERELVVSMADWQSCMSGGGAERVAAAGVA